MAHRFNVGDRVTVRPDLTAGYYSSTYFNPSMAKFRGKTFVVDDLIDPDEYRLTSTDDELRDVSSWCFNEYMVHPEGEKYLLPGHHVLLNGEEVVISERDNYNCFTVNKYRDYFYERDFTLIEGYDYTKPPPTINVGDVVKIVCLYTLHNYGRTSINSCMADRFGEFAIVTSIVDGKYFLTQEGIYNRSLRNGVEKWTWTRPMLDPVNGNNELFKCGETAMALTYSTDLLLPITEECLLPHYEKTEEVKIKLNADVFGIGEKDTTLTAYRGAISQRVVTQTVAPIIGALYEGEYTEV